MGLGKTVISLTAVDELLCEREVKRILIVAPLYAMLNTWPQEIEKWPHLKKLTYQVIRGNEQERYNQLAGKEDIHFINPELFPWLCKYVGTAWWYDCVVWDESSSLKNHAGIWFNWMRAASPYIKYFVELTGTPACSGLLSIWSQIYLIDNGNALGKFITHYRQKYFIPNPSGYGYVLPKDKEKEIHEQVKGLVYRLKAEDYIDMPEQITNDHILTLSSSLDSEYRKFEKERLLEVYNVDGTLKEDVEAPNITSVIGKLLQFCNGAVYRNEKINEHDFIEVHDIKIKRLKEIIAGCEGQPVVLGYLYKSDLARIRKHFKNIATPKDDNVIERWNNGEIEILAVQQNSRLHGLNLQYAGHILILYGLTWSLENLSQLIGRLARQGQKHPVIIHRVLISGTMENRVIKRLIKNQQTEQSLLDAVGQYVRKVFKDEQDD